MVILHDICSSIDIQQEDRVTLMLRQQIAQNLC